MTPYIRTQRQNLIFEIVIDRPDKRNALDWPMMTAMGEAFGAAERVSGVRAVVIRGAGSGFSAGIDVTAFPDSAAHFGNHWRENLFPLTAAYQAVTNIIERCSLPTIALLHGYCFGLGFEIALACDFRIAAVDTKMGLPESRLGIIPDVGGTTRLTRLIGAARAKEYIMTGKHFDLAAAERWGLINHLVPAEELMATSETLVADLAQAAPLAVGYAKRVINDLADTTRGLQLEAWAQNQLIRTRDFETGIQAMLSKQPPEWEGK